VVDQELVDTVKAAGDGDEQAWDVLVERFSRLVWSVARSHRLSDADAADVSQTTWLRLAEHLHRLRDPAKVASWLATTARNESLRTLRRSARVVPVDVDLDGDLGRSAPAADGRILLEERDAALWAAFDQLPDPCRALLRTLMADPAPSYAEISEALGMPIGSIGPRRARCLDRLRGRSELDVNVPDWRVAS
jgi:RNA polymerase sigma factor (sigma-70 family)